MSEPPRSIPDWNMLYKNEEVTTMLWYNKNLDFNLKGEFDKRNILTDVHGYKFLDLGTGPGTQAVQLANLGFDVTAIDISEYAIEKAKKLSNKVNFIVDNILESKLGKEEFDYIFDRGCFHGISPGDRQKYIAKVKDIIKKEGILFLKCFSEKELREEGPYRFSPDRIKKIFGNDFEILSIKETDYSGDVDPVPPKALFVVMRKK
jgi:SAM-dependent methyltransferase